jgi:hypothetical protein
MSTGMHENFGQLSPRPTSSSGGSDNNWIKQLVEKEAEALRSGVADFLGNEDHRRVVVESTKEYMLELKEEFAESVDLFNSYRGGAHLPNSIKIFNISNSAGDFILFRNTLKLVVSNPAMGVINVSFVSRENAFKKSVPMTSADPVKREGYDLIAQLFPFNELVWTYHGERVNTKALVRYLFTEFVRSSAIF